MLQTFRVREVRWAGNIQKGLAEEVRPQRMDLVERGSREAGTGVQGVTLLVVV